jgi:hypothetical protein
LESVRGLGYTNYLTIVVDNGSWNDSAGRIAAWARERLGSGHVLAEYSRETALQGGEAKTEQALDGVPSPSRLVVIRNEENLGFTGGNNVAIRYALERRGAADFVLFLNNDAVLEPTCLTELVSTDRRADAGVIGAVTKNKATGELLFAGGGMRSTRWLGCFSRLSFPGPGICAMWRPTSTHPSGCAEQQCWFGRRRSSLFIGPRAATSTLHYFFTMTKPSFAGRLVPEVIMSSWRARPLPTTKEAGGTAGAGLTPFFITTTTETGFSLPKRCYLLI